MNKRQNKAADFRAQSGGFFFSGSFPWSFHANGFGYIGY